MKRAAAGFSMVEIMFALVIGGVLTGIAVSSVAPIMDKQAVQSAQKSFVSMHARARALAIERGTTARFHVHMGGDSIWVSQGGQLVESMDLHRLKGVTLHSGRSEVNLCMTPRGYADPDCSSMSSSVSVRFTRRTEGAQVMIQPLGQLIY